MPAGDVWGNSWLASWNASWKQAAAASTATFSQHGRGRYGTGWAAKTLSQIAADEKKAEIARLKKVARRRLRAEQKRGVTDLDALMNVATAQINRAIPESANWMTDEYVRAIATIVLDGLERARIERMIADEDDAEAILLIAA